MFARAMFLCVVAAAAAPHLAQAEGGGPGLPKGDFVHVADRAASGVAAPAPPMRPGPAEPLSARIAFGDTAAWLDGSSCDPASMRVKGEDQILAADPNLSDIQVGPAGGPLSLGDRRLNRALSITCGGRERHLIQVDQRVLVVPTPDGATWRVFEKPLSEAEIKAFQAHLKDTKFLSAAPSGRLDEPTLKAIAVWAEYRGAQYRFVRPAISENLLDAVRMGR